MRDPQQGAEQKKKFLT